MSRLLLALALSSAALSVPAETVSRIAMGSCADEKLEQPIWDAILGSRPDLFLFLGDNVYADTESVEKMRASYDLLGNEPGYQRLRNAVPIEAIWDDHDYGVNDGDRTFPMREAAAEVFLDFFDEPADSLRRQRDGIYAVREYGPPAQRIQLILLDTRYFKSPWKKSWNPARRYAAADDPSLTMLGEAQWEWLETQLRKPARLRLIASGIQIINDEQPYESWGNFPHERRRLFELISATGATGTILLSGDRHFSEIAELDANIGYPLLELTSSGMTHPWEDGPASEEHSNRIAAYGDFSFGTVTVNWSVADPVVTLAIHDIDGNEVSAVSRPLSQLQPALSE